MNNIFCFGISKITRPQLVSEKTPSCLRQIFQKYGACCRKSFSKDFFLTASRRIIDKRTGEESDVNFDVCNLHVGNQPEKLCEKSYKCLPRFGSANLKRHILNKHSMNPAVQSYIRSVNSKLEKVVQN